MRIQWNMNLMMMALGLATSIAGTAAYATTNSKVDLVATAAAPTATGKARIAVRNASTGIFEVSVQGLAPRADYELVLGGIKVTTLRTNQQGVAHLRFTTRGHRGTRFLGFDPRGQAIEVRQGSGDDVLLATLPKTTDGGAKVPCCVPDDRGSECEDRAADECVAQGGTVAVATSCLPDPCGAAPPVGSPVVCCVPDETGPLCEDRTQADCATAGGTMVAAASCTPNPCAAAPAPPDTHVQCCVAAYYVWACEDHTVDECQTLGGIDKGPGACSPNPCGDVPPSRGHGICCLPNAAGDEVECEDRAATDCSAAGGVVKSGQVCDPTICADVLPPTPDIACCVPNAAGTEIECEDLTAASCAAAGGTGRGAGVCALDTCADIVAPNAAVMCCLPKGNGESECQDRSATQCTATGGFVAGAGACPAIDPCGGGHNGGGKN